MPPGASPFGWGTPVVPRRQFDQREDRLWLYRWGTVVRHHLIALGTVLVVGR